MRAELKRAADLVAFQRREALSRKRLSGDPRNPFRPRYGAELTFAAASQEAETLGYGDPTMTEETPAPEPTIKPGEGFSEEGNLVTRDLLYDEHTNKQFIHGKSNDNWHSR